MAVEKSISGTVWYLDGSYYGDGAIDFLLSLENQYRKHDLGFQTKF